MPRPRKFRRVYRLPASGLYGPIDKQERDGEIIMMAVEEYEAIRLIDMEGLSQQECAQSMNVARTTVQKIYSDARLKLAQSLVEGRALRIEGGNYKLHDECMNMNSGKRRRRQRCGRNFGNCE